MVKIGLYLCHCGTNIAGKVDIDKLKEFAKDLSDVTVIKNYEFMCSDPGQQIIKADIKSGKIDRVVVACCSPNMHEKTFRKAAKEEGLNEYLIQIANVREQCSWVTDDPKMATQKARSIIAAAVKRASLLAPLDAKSVPMTPKVAIIGGGIAGIQAALDLADAGREVHLIEKEPSIGGHMAQFDKTFPTLDCAACILTPKMVDAGRHPNIHLHTYSEVEKVDGFVGNFKLTIRKRARFVDEEKCTSCGACWQVCPAKRFKKDKGKALEHKHVTLGPDTAIHVPSLQAVPMIPVIDRSSCLYFKTGACKLCAKECPTGAVNYEQTDRLEEVDVGAIIVATGFKPFDSSRIEQYGYGRYDNVITALEFERMNCASGSTGGEILMTNGHAPQSIGIIHCVGSRDVDYNPHCSRVCCMYALKFAHLIKEKTNADVYNFYIDIRAFGKGYEEFYDRLLKEGVKFVRGRPALVTDFAERNSEKGKLIVQTEDTLMAEIVRVPVDMVILCPAMEACDSAGGISKKLAMCESADGFFAERHPKLAPVSTAVDGIFIAGACQGPKDIPDTVAQASAAASQVQIMLGKKEWPIDSAVASVDSDKCSGCQVCISLCPYHAISFDEEKKISVINEALCKGCGTCVAACPCEAITAHHFTDEQIDAELEGLIKEGK